MQMVQASAALGWGLPPMNGPPSLSRRRLCAWKRFIYNKWGTEQRYLEAEKFPVLLQKPCFPLCAGCRLIVDIYVPCPCLRSHKSIRKSKRADDWKSYLEKTQAACLWVTSKNVFGNEVSCGMFLETARRRCPFPKLFVRGGSGERLSRSVWVRGTGASTAELLQPACDRRAASFLAFSYNFPFVLNVGWRNDDGGTFSPVFSSQSYDGGFGQGAGRESHGEYDRAATAHLVGRRRKTPAFMVEDMEVADGSNWFKGLTIITLSSLIPPLLRLNTIILTQKPFTLLLIHMTNVNLITFGLT